MKRIKPFQVNVNLSLRFAFAALALFLLKSNPITAAIGAAIIFMFFPVLTSKKNVMSYLRTGTADTDEDLEKALLDKIEKSVKKMLDGIEKETLTPEKVEKLVQKINKETAKLTEDGLSDLRKKMDALSESNTFLVNQATEAKEALKAQSAELKKLKETGTEETAAEKQLTFKQALRAAFMEQKDNLLKEVSDDHGKRLSMKGFFSKVGQMGRTPEMTIKAPVDMFLTNIGFASGDTQNNNLRLTALDPQRVGIPLNVYPHVMDVYQVKSIAKPYMALLVAYSYENGAGIKLEGAAAVQSSLLFKTVIFPAFFISTYFNLSDETLDDLDEAIDEISIVAPDKIMDKIDAQIDRTGGDDIVSIKGILHTDKSTAYARQMDASSVPGAYIVDLIADAQLQCEQNRYRANVVKMNPKTTVLLAAAKNSFDDSKSDRRVQFDNLGNPVSVCGLRIIKSNDLATTALLVLDNTQPWIGRRRDMTMEIGYNGTDLVEGQKTVIMKVRLAFGVRDKAAIIYVSDIAAGIAALAQ